MRNLSQACDQRLLIAVRKAFRALYGLPPDAGRPLDAAVDSGFRLRARRHRVAGLLAANGAADANWQQTAYGQALHTARLTAEAERLVARLAPRLRALLLIKGPVLAEQAWPEKGLRDFDDLDFRCHRNDAPALGVLLHEAGYRPEIDDARTQSHYWHFGWGIGFVHPTGFRVEVNHRFFPPHYPWPRGGADVMPQNLDACLLDTREVPAPTPALHLLLCCLHALWHGGGRLAWVIDIAGLLVKHPDALAQAEGITGGAGYAMRALHSGCVVAEQVFGPGVVSRRDLPHAVEPVANVFVAQLCADPPPTPGAQRLLHNGLLSRTGKVAYALRRGLIPGDGDFRALKLSRGLRPVYWIYRPIRLTRSLLPRLMGAQVDTALP